MCIPNNTSRPPTVTTSTKNQRTEDKPIRSLNNRVSAPRHDGKDRRWCLVTVDLPNSPPINIVFVHGPHVRQRETWQRIAEEVTPKRNERVLIIGDMNCFVDHEDAISTKTPPSPAFQEMIEQLQLSDAWRLQNPVDITHASFVRTMRQPGMPDRVDRSRIDHAFVNDLLLEEITECKYGDFDLVVSPDHCPIIITLSSADANIPTSSGSLDSPVARWTRRRLAGLGLAACRPDLASLRALRSETVEFSQPRSVSLCLFDRPALL
jgi:endonuclease/exonuclease/phosphatase family metal-dependent hydrolase